MNPHKVYDDVMELSAVQQRVIADNVCKQHGGCGDLFASLHRTNSATNEIVRLREKFAAEKVRFLAALAERDNEIVLLHGLLESLTPGGSEFHQSPERCAEFAKDRMAGVIKQVKKRKAAEAEVVRLRDALATVPEWVLVPAGWGSARRECPICENLQKDGHAADCIKREEDPHA